MKKIIFITLLAFSLIACNKAPEIVYDSEENTPIAVNAVNSLLTKAPVTGTTFPTTRGIQMSTYYNAPVGDGTSANYFTGIAFTKKAGDNTLWECGKYWPLSGTLDFLGYSLDNFSHVSSVSWGANNCASVTMTLSDNKTNQDDLLVGGASALTSTSNSMVFKHAETLLTCRASSSVAYNSTTNMGITITDIKFNSVKNSGTVACTRSGSEISFAWSSLGSAADVSLPSMAATNLGTSLGAISGTPGLIVPPQQETSLTIYYTLHNGKDSSSANIDNTLQYTFTPVSPISWLPGKKYTYDITITLTAIEVSASVTDWSNQTQTYSLPEA